MDNAYTKHSITLNADVLRDHDVLVAIGDAFMAALSENSPSVDGNAAEGTLTVFWFEPHIRSQPMHDEPEHDCRCAELVDWEADDG